MLNARPCGLGQFGKAVVPDVVVYLKKVISMIQIDPVSVALGFVIGICVTISGLELFDYYKRKKEEAEGKIAYY